MGEEDPRLVDLCSALIRLKDEKKKYNKEINDQIKGVEAQIEELVGAE